MTQPFKSSIYIRKINVRKAAFSYCQLCTESFGDGYGIGIFQRVNGVMQLIRTYHFNCFKKYLTSFGALASRRMPEVWKEKEHILKELEEKYTPEMVLEKL